MRIAVVGLGAVGSRAARQLVSSTEVTAVILRDVRPARIEEVAARRLHAWSSTALPGHGGRLVILPERPAHSQESRELVARGFRWSGIDDLADVGASDPARKPRCGARRSRRALLYGSPVSWPVRRRRQEVVDEGTWPSPYRGPRLRRRKQPVARRAGIDWR